MGTACSNCTSTQDEDQLEMSEEEMQAHLRMVQAKNRVAITSQHLDELPNRFKGGQYVLDNSKTTDGHRVFSNNVSKDFQRGLM